MVQRLLISGYKAHELGIYDDQHPGIAYIKKAITREIVQLIETGLNWVIVTGQTGVEQWAAESVLSLKNHYPHLKLAVITPFLQQEENWKPKRQEVYRHVLQEADFTDSISKQPYQGSWQFKQKNKFLLRNSDALLVLFDKDDENGSPKYLMREAEALAQTSDYQIIMITPDDLQIIVEEETSFHHFQE
ncbi:DUF1273 domain-containing protein [Bacillaceae bacterium Marseille-Q3522]|nr:DUF1273 domain-containing protein [Bacillaceae bacterium Marseille-Q3522]